MYKQSKIVYIDTMTQYILDNVFSRKRMVNRIRAVYFRIDRLPAFARSVISFVKLIYLKK